jgi:hypothetical protein
MSLPATNCVICNKLKDSMPAGLSATGKALIKDCNMRALSLRITVNSFCAAAFSSFVFFRWAC